MKNVSIRLPSIHKRLSTLLCVAGAIAATAQAQSTWNGGGADQNWSTAGNWTSGAPGSSSPVIFPDGTFPVTTNVAGQVNNIVQSSTAIASLTYNNAANHFDTTLIPSGVTLTESGNIVVGGSVPSPVAVTGGGSLVGGSGTSTVTIQSTSGTAVFDLSTLTNFIFNATGNGGAFSLSTGSSSASGRINLAAGSNFITATTLSLGNNNTGGTGTMNLGNGTNIIRADTISMGIDKTTGTMQFLNNAGGGLTIANHTGTGRAAVNVSSVAGSGGTGSVNTGNLLLDGGTVNILAGNLIVGNRGNRPDHSGTGSPTGGALGILAFNNGIVDANFINMATNSSSGGFATGTIAVGGTGTLKVGAAGFSLVNQGSSSADPANGTLIVTNGGTVICAGSIYKGIGQSAGTGIVWVANSSLSVGVTMGATNGIPIDFFNITNSTLTLAAGTSASVLVVNLNPDATTSNVINVSSMPTITTFPSQFPIISYQTAAGNLNSFALGTLPGLPGTFSGYISNNTTSLTIDLVVTNGPVAKADQWSGSVNSLWDTTTLNWINSGVATNYNDLDQVTFDDSATSTNVSLSTTRVPASLAVNNNVLNYVFTGAGKISGSVGVTKSGTASLTLAETGGDNFAGGITVSDGTLVLDNANSAISGGLTISGGTVQIGNNDAVGTLPSGTLDNEGTLVYDRSDSITVGTVIPGGGALVQNGSGRLALSGNNTFSGSTTVNNGTLALTNSGAIASSTSVTINSNATLDVSGVTTSASLQALALSNATVNVKVGYLQTNFNVSSLTLTGSTNVINVRSLPPIAVYPTTNVLLLSGSPITGNNLGLGSLPSASPAFVGTNILSADQMSVLLVLTAGPIGVRPTVNWSGVDALGGINTNWSDAQNWQTPGVPAAGERIAFDNTAAASGSPFDLPGDGNGGIVTPANIDNIVDINATNTGISFANTSFHNTLVNPGKTLALNGALTVSGSGGSVAILGTNGAVVMNNPSNNTTLNVENGSTAPTLDLSGLDTFTATVNQVGVGFNASSSAFGNGTLYLARTNTITGGFGSSGSGSSLVVSGSGSGTTGKLYLGQSNALFLDGVTMGIAQSVNNLIAFNPAVTNLNPYAFIRGITGNSSRMTRWSIGDASVNLNNGADGFGHVVDFTGGTVDALVNTLIVGQGAQGNTFNTQVMGTFNLSAGKLDVTSLQIGVGDSGKNGGTGIGIMNVTGGNLIANSLSLAVGGPTNTAGTLNLTNASTVLSNGVTIGANTAGGTLSVIDSTLKVLGGTLGTPPLPLTALNLDGATVQLNADASTGVANVVSTNITAASTTTINIAAITNVSGSAQIPLISYAGSTADPYPNLALGTTPAGYTIGNGGLLVDNTANLTIDVIVNNSTAPTTNASILSVTLFGTNLVLHGTNNNGGQNFRYAVLTSTNLALPLSSWTVLGTNLFNQNGTFDYTNPVSPSLPRAFFDIQVVQ